MKETTKTGLKVLLLATVAGVAGCASTSDIDTLRSQVAQATETANRAAADAAAAREEAAAASRAASEAKAAAEAAKAASESTDAKLDRMFKKAMYK